MSTTHALHLLAASLAVLPILLTCSTEVGAHAMGGSAKSDSPQAVMTGYLEQLQKLDQTGMNRFLAEKVTSRGLDGEERILDRAAMRQMRDFERGVKTSWAHRVTNVAGERVTVELIERNEFYDLLGVGARTQVANYFVRDGRIYRMETASSSQESGDFQKVYESFKRWLSTIPAAASDVRLTHDRAATLIFDRESAVAMRPWLQRWAAEKRARSPMVREQ